MRKLMIAATTLGLLSSTVPSNAQYVGYPTYYGSPGVWGYAGAVPAVAIGAGILGGLIVSLAAPKVYTPPVVTPYPNPVHTPVSQECPYARVIPLYDAYGTFLGTKTSCF